MLTSKFGSLDLPIFVVRIVSPCIVFLATLTLILARPATQSQPNSSPITPVVVASRVPRRAWILSLLTLAALTYLLDGMVYVIYAVLQHHKATNLGLEVNAVLGLLSLAGLAALGTWKDIHGVEVWLLKRVRSAVAITTVLDIALAVLIGLTLKSATPAHSPVFYLPIPILLQLVFPAFRVLLYVPLLVSLAYPRTVYSPSTEDNDDDATPTSSTLLLPPGEHDVQSSGLTVPGQADSKYGTFPRPTRSMLQQSNPGTRAPTPTPDPTKQESKPEISLEPSWSEIWQRLRRLRPYLWPSKSRPLQLLAAICMVILLIGRVINGILPFALGELTRIFEGQSTRSPWTVLGLFVALRFLQGSGGLNALRDTLWTPVMQYSDREMSQLSFNHLLDLSFAFHTRRKTGEVLRILDRGAAINHSLELILFNILPTFLDILVALVIFCVTFEWTLAVVVFLVITTYVAASVILTQWRTRIRREMNERDVITRGIHTDCLLNYETVKYFCGEEHEANRYADALRQYQTLEYKVIVSLNLLNLVQNFIISLGLLIGSIIVAHHVLRQPRPSAGDFIIFITLLNQLYSPLNQLGYLYRSMNQSLVDTEKLLKLLNEPKEINDKPGAPDLVVEDGEIEFENVNFSYDGRTTALKGVSFKVPKNSSVALVGESGSGKSTILRLLYRFYDLEEGQGRILIDGKDIRDVTQKSLRHAIGVVPQDSVLFNTSIKYNIGYGKLDAGDDEIEAAAKSAQMHDRILSFPDGYETTVGERGVRLSGGEKQRVAIARTLLKNPPILLLDEATSALDTSTEKDIQKALQNLIEGRSSLSIAHRLSTIASADIILVLKDGQIVEQGSHRDLVAQDGIFASMWADQISASEDPAVSIAKKSSQRSIKAPSRENEGVQEDVQDNEHSVAESVPAENQPEPYVVDEPSAAPSVRSVAANSIPPKVATPPVAFPASGPSVENIGSPPEPSAPVAFPTSSNDQAMSPPTNVTFEDSRSATPDDPESKKKGRGTQNFQRMARRISLTTKRSESSGGFAAMIPGLRRDKDHKDPSASTSPRMSEDNAAGGSLQGSPAPSVTSADKGKKDKKDKKRRMSVLTPSTKD